MEWKDLARVAALLTAFATLLAFFGGMWWQLDNKITVLDSKFERRFEQVNARFEQVNVRFNRLEALLTENLITLNRDIGKLSGASHIHTQPPSPR